MLVAKFSFGFVNIQGSFRHHDCLSLAGEFYVSAAVSFGWGNFLLDSTDDRADKFYKKHVSTLLKGKSNWLLSTF